jgi:hypothetical protein
MKAGRRPRVGEQPSIGEVRPVTARHVLMLSLGVLLLVVLATTAILIASSGTKKAHPTDTNVPKGVKSSSQQSPTPSPS